MRCDNQDVGQAALPILLTMLERDAPEDMDTAKAVLETLNMLCEVEDQEGKVRSYCNQNTLAQSSRPC